MAKKAKYTIVNNRGEVEKVTSKVSVGCPKCGKAICWKH